MLDWCRCVCKRTGQHQCFESSVRPHYFTPGLGTAIPHRLAYSPARAAGISSPLASPPFRFIHRSLARSFVRSLARIPMHTTDTY